MNWADFFLNPAWLLELPGDLKRERRMRRAAARSQGDDLADLADQNAQLPLLLSAVVALLAEKGLLRANEVARKVKELTPQYVAPVDKSPFAGFQE